MPAEIHKKNNLINFIAFIINLKDESALKKRTVADKELK
jgi:hypothetical protein